jgi:hypothetical protein
MTYSLSRTAGKVDHPLTGEFRGILERGIDVGGGKRGIASQECLFIGAGGKVIENDGNHHSRSLNTGLAVTDCRINANAISPVHWPSPLEWFVAANPYLSD